VIIQTCAFRVELTDQLHLEAKAKCFTDGISFVLNGERKAEYVVVSHEEVTEAWPLPAGTSAQKAKLITLIKALILGNRKRVNECLYQLQICLPGITCSCSHMVGEGIPLQEEVLNKTWKGNSQFLEAIHLQGEVAVIHCW
jgi:hypothetical protein